MASKPTPDLPLFYNDLTPLNARDHGKWHSRAIDTADWLVGQHAVPVTVEEFPMAARHFPIIFSAGENPVPLALMGLDEGVNTFIGDDGEILEDFYFPAYVRRYPYMLAQVDPNNELMSLCVDPTSKTVGEFEEGQPLFDGEEPSETLASVMKFCERFEEAGQRTKAFMNELIKHDLLMEGEVGIKLNDAKEDDQPYVYRGFKMIDGDKLKEVRGDQLRTWNQNGLLSMIYTQIFSLDLMRVIFARQTAQGKGPGAQLQNKTEDETKNKKDTKK